MPPEPEAPPWDSASGPSTTPPGSLGRRDPEVALCPGHVAAAEARAREEEEEAAAAAAAGPGEARPAGSDVGLALHAVSD